MKHLSYTQQQVKETEKLITAIHSIPSDKRAILMAMTEAFIGGMKAQERLMLSGKSKAEASGKRI